MNNLVTAPSPIVTDNLTGFWPRLLSDTSLDSCADLEKLLAGCEIIAALDDLGLLTS